MARSTDPKKRRASFGQLECDFKADNVPVESDRALQVADREMSFEEAGRRLDGHVVTSAIGSLAVSARWANGW
jgi:hypothetical protein